MTPVSPRPNNEDVMESVEKDPGAEPDEDEDDGAPVVSRMGRMGASKQAKPKTQSVSARRKFARREASARIDEEAFRDWDYRMDISDYTPERCEELERIYWKTLTYAAPLYGADLPGTLFEDDSDVWNLNKLPNLLDVLGTKVPGVNTAYLYLGMWKATFAWHLEDVDLYSINYLHFGAPKQWYSISQGDARRFEAAMKSIWPTDAKACDQFLRHKAFLISPNHLQQYYNIKVNKCVSYPGEFVVTYPYGYHSGYNLGYNCAEAVNFALDSWLPMGKIAKRCECAQAQDSVWVDVYEIERKLRGEETDYEETEDEDEDEDDEDDEDTGVGSPQASHLIKIKQPGHKRKRTLKDQDERTGKKIRLRVRPKTQVDSPCCLCPNNFRHEELLETDDGRQAHRTCALYGAETWIETVDGKDRVANVTNISKDRLGLKCLFCRSKRGACFHCSHRKCVRSYHATCAAAAGVFVEEGEVPIFGEDGTEYKEQAFDFTCRFHRAKRDKKMDSNTLDDCPITRKAAEALKTGDIAQMQYHHKTDIFAGIVVENRQDEQMLLLETIPNGDRVEVEWKWLVLSDPADFHLPKASANAIPMPTSRKAKEEINATKQTIEELPRAQDAFVEGFTWAEFHHTECINRVQAKVDLSKENQIWHYLGKTSTEARAQYTEDPRKPVHNYKSNFLESVPKPAPPVGQPRKVYTPTYPKHLAQAPAGGKADKPYQYKPKHPVQPAYAAAPAHPPVYTNQSFAYNGAPFPTTAATFAPRPPYTPQSATNPPCSPQSGSMPWLAPETVTQSAARPPTQPAPGATSQHATAKPMFPPPATPSTPRLPKTTPPHTTHSRHRSLPYGSDSRFRTPSSTYASARYDLNSSSPFSFGFMQPPGLGTTPSPQNGQLFQAQARARSMSSASAKSLNTPMTSSAIRPSSSASEGMVGQSQVGKLPLAQGSPPPSVVQKYSYFQGHHNRDSTKYRTPYAPWGGFTNGYEGNLRAHLMKSPDALFSIQRHPNGVPGVPGASPLQHQPGPTKGSAFSPDSPAYQSPHEIARKSTPSTSSKTSPSGMGSQDAYGPPSSAPTPSGGVMGMPSGSWDPNCTTSQVHPAIRSQYANMLQQQSPQPQPQSQPAAQNNCPPVHYSPQASSSQAQEQVPHPRPPSAHKQHRSHRYPASSPVHIQPPSQYVSPPPPLRAQQSPQDQQLPHTQLKPQFQRQPYAEGAHGALLPQAIASSGMSPSPNAQPPVARDGRAHRTQKSSPSTTQKRPPAPKQTFVPPPRPWEQLQKAPQSPQNPTTASGPPSSTTTGPQPAQGQGFHPHHSQSDAVQPRPSTAQEGPPLDVATPTPASPQAKEIPEVPAESFALVEDIIRNARRASGSKFAP